MKKVILLFVSFFLFSINVFAVNLDFKVVEGLNEYELEITLENGKTITWQDAKRRYKVDDLIVLKHKNEYVHFYQGNHILDQELISLNLKRDISKEIAKYSPMGIKVTNTADIINVISDIYDTYKSQKYYLFYDEKDLANIDFAYLEKFLRHTYINPINQNYYKYTEYSNYKPLKFMPLYNDYMMIIDATSLKTNKEELEKVKKSKDIFMKELKNKSSYEQLHALYDYLKTNTKFDTSIINNSFEGNLSVYDTLFKHKSGCIGLTTTLQFLLEELNIESYIVERVANIDESERIYNTSHTYNVVLLDNKYYVIDLSLVDGFLLGLDSLSVHKDDFANIPVTIADKTYPKKESSFTLDNNKINIKLNNILKGIEFEEEPKEEKEEENTMPDMTFYKYLILFLILLVIFLIIFIFTRRK